MSKGNAKQGSTPKGVKQRTVPQELPTVVLEALRDAQSIKGAQFKKKLPVSYQAFDKEARAIAQRLAEQNEVHRWTKGAKEIFFANDPDSTIELALLPLVTATPLDELTLKAHLAEAAPGHEDLLKDWLQSAVKRKVLYEHRASKGFKKRFGRQPDIVGTLRSTLTALRKALQQTDAQGLSRTTIADALLQELGLPPTAAPSAQPSGQVLSALRTLVSENPRQALLSVRDLRARLKLSKDEFDSAALALSREGVISLHHHDHPASLSDLEREQLVRDARGTHYIGIALRRG